MTSGLRAGHGLAAVDVLGAAAAEELATHLDIHTVGELVRHYPRRYLERGELTDIAGLQLGEYATLVAQGRDGHAAATCATGTARCWPWCCATTAAAGWTATFFNPLQAARRDQAGGAGAVRRQGRRVPRQAAAHPPAVRAAAPTATRSGRSCRSTRPPPSCSPGRSATACGRCSTCSTTRPTRCRPRCAGREGLAELGRALRRIHVPETEADHHAAPQPAGLGRGDGRAAGAGAAPAGHGVPAGARLPAEAGRPARRVRRPAAVHPDRGPGRGGRRDRRRPRRGAPDEPAGAGRRRRGQDGDRAAGDAAGGRRRPAGRAARADRGAGRPARPFAARAARPARPWPGSSAAPSEATSVTLLTGSLGAKARRQALLDAQSGAAGIVVGTHALIQDHVGFADLGLVVVDEQHRFGVEQRDALRGRGELAPHMLVMTATPIPRTVAMTVYGDLEVSALRELPGRAVADRHHRGAAGRAARPGSSGCGGGCARRSRPGTRRTWCARGSATEPAEAEPTDRTTPRTESEPHAARRYAVLDVRPQLAEGALHGPAARASCTASCPPTRRTRRCARSSAASWTCWWPPR